MVVGACQLANTLANTFWNTRFSNTSPLATQSVCSHWWWFVWTCSGIQLKFLQPFATFVCQSIISEQRQVETLNDKCWTATFLGWGNIYFGQAVARSHRLVGGSNLRFCGLVQIINRRRRFAKRGGRRRRRRPRLMLRVTECLYWKLLVEFSSLAALSLCRLAAPMDSSGNWRLAPTIRRLCVVKPRRRSMNGKGKLNNNWREIGGAKIIARARVKSSWSGPRWFSGTRSMGSIASIL